MFELVNNQVTVHPNSLALPFLRAIWDLDKSKTKDVAFKELSYIFYLMDVRPNNPYASYPIEKRKEFILKDIMKDTKWTPSKLVEEACVKYSEVSRTQSMELLESAKSVVGKIKDYFDGVDFKEVKLDRGGNEVLAYNAKDVMSIIGGLGKLVESLSSLEEKVKREITQNSTVRGNKQISLYED